MTRPAAGANLTDQGKDQILRRAGRRQFAVDRDAHAFDGRLQKGLARHDMFDLGRADTEREGAKRTVRCRVTVTAHQSRTGQGKALLRANDVDDAVPRIIDFEQLNAKIRTVAAQRIDLQLRVFGNLFVAVRRDVVVDHRERQFRTAHLPTRHLQPLERLRARDFVNDMAVDIQKARAILLLVDQMRFPNLFK